MKQVKRTAIEGVRNGLISHSNAKSEHLHFQVVLKIEMLGNTFYKTQVDSSLQ